MISYLLVLVIFIRMICICSTKNDGSVVTWGNGYGDNSSSVSDGLSSGVKQIFSTSVVMAALKVDGSVVTWGLSSNGGDSSSVMISYLLVLVIFIRINMHL